MYSKDDEIKYFETTNKLLEKDIEILDLDVLKDVIRYHEWKYYIQDNPVISDYDYDILFKKLQRLEAQNPDYVTVDSPTKRVGSDLTNEFQSVSHYSPMLSLENSYNEEDLWDFDKQVKKLSEIDSSQKVEYVIEPKYDGSTIVLVYENDVLIRAATRGTGQAGDDITNNARVIRSIPLKAKFSKFNIHRAEIRGEALIGKDVFEKLNSLREKEKQPLFINPRNAASGSLRMKDASEVKNRNLTVFSYQLAYAVDKEGNSLLQRFDKHSDFIKMLSSLGFRVPQKATKICQGIEDTIQFCKDVEGQRAGLNFEIDGLVIKVNDIKIQEQCGYTSHHPRWAIAFKYKAQQAVSTLERVEYQVGRFGTITPVAKITPVFIGGVTVSSISLHNEDFIVKKDLHIGDKVVVERAGEVIPYIVKSLPELRKGTEEKIIFPKYCPSNHSGQESVLQKADDEAAWYCSDSSCEDTNLQKLIFFVSKNGMDFDGFGESYVSRFVDLGWIKNLSDFYDLDYELIAKLEGFGAKSASNIAIAVEKSKKNPLWRVMHSLSIKHLGKRASKLIAQRIKTIWELKNWKEEDFIDIKDIGPSVANSVIAWFESDENIKVLQKLEQFGVNTRQTEEDKPVEVIEETPLSGKTILFTGKLLELNRKQAQDLAEKAGAKNTSSVSKNLNILVVGEKAGSKLKKAQEIGSIEIYDEEEFIKILKELNLFN